ncbi:hypothetical protein WA026_009069 [Henosepilachna vigintioctopunctata]|uniref:Uncharacterized protein n=1 Tax=Henosepilachna vigintioctopunctata TaxID=420089 RepID=A0AAW1UPU4_9CUCU
MFGFISYFRKPYVPQRHPERERVVLGNVDAGRPLHGNQAPELGHYFMDSLLDILQPTPPVCSASDPTCGPHNLEYHRVWSTYRSVDVGHEPMEKSGDTTGHEYSEDLRILISIKRRLNGRRPIEYFANAPGLR